VNTDLSFLEVTEIPLTSILPDNSVWNPYLLVVAVHPKTINAAKVLLVPGKSRVIPILTEGGLKCHCTGVFVHLHHTHDL
jgi:hypothetical protein